MAVIAATNKSNVPDLEIGEVYDFVVKSVEDAEDNGKFKSDFPRQVITYTLKDEAGKTLAGDDGKPITVKQWLTLYNPMRPRSAVYGVFSALQFAGKEIPEGEMLDTDDLVGKKGRLLWGMKSSPDGKDTSPGIVQVMPPRKAAARAVVTEDDIDNV